MVQFMLRVVSFCIICTQIVGLSEKCDLKDENSENKEILWFINMPSLPLLLENSNSLQNGECKKQLELYLKFLKNGTLWAVESK